MPGEEIFVATSKELLCDAGNGPFQQFVSTPPSLATLPPVAFATRERGKAKWRAFRVLSGD